VLRLGEDGYVSYEGGVLEVGLLRECGEVDEVRSFEDGVVYVYRRNVCNNGVFRGKVPVVYSDVNSVASMATFGSIFLTVVGLIRGI
jgi:hypothetical protein